MMQNDDFTRERRFELLEWRDRRYQHVQFIRTTAHEAKRTERSLNRGYTGPRFVIREA